jgi:hypothetical protein
MDIHFVIDEPTISFYNAMVFTNMLVLIQPPGWLCSPLNNLEELKKHVTENVTNAVKDARHAYYKNKSRREYKYKNELSSKEINVETEDDKK